MERLVTIGITEGKREKGSKKTTYVNNIKEVLHMAEVYDIFRIKEERERER